MFNQTNLSKTAQNALAKQIARPCKSTFSHQFKSKIDFMNALPEFLNSSKTDYHIYFVTFTFKNPRQAIPYASYCEFFHLFRKKLDRFLLPNHHVYQTRPILILIPEDTSILHFHGFLLIHKKIHEKFLSKCVSEYLDEHLVNLDQHKISYRLNHKIINPYSPISRNDDLKNRIAAESNAPILHVEDYKIYSIENCKEFHSTVFYSSKNICRDINFDYDRIIIESKSPSKLYKERND